MRQRRLDAATDVGRWVVQCACGWARRWHGEEHARLGGWHPRVRGRSLVWTCPECWRPELAPEEAARMPAFLRTLIVRGSRSLVLEQLAVLRATAPAIADACLDVIEREGRAALSNGRKAKASPWLALGRQLGRIEAVG